MATEPETSSRIAELGYKPKGKIDLQVRGFPKMENYGEKKRIIPSVSAVIGIHATKFRRYTLRTF